jgi:hypothetical protein
MPARVAMLLGLRMVAHMRLDDRSLGRRLRLLRPLSPMGMATTLVVNPPAMKNVTQSGGHCREVEHGR